MNIFTKLIAIVCFTLGNLIATFSVAAASANSNSSAVDSCSQLKKSFIELEKTYLDSFQLECEIAERSQKGIPGEVAKSNRIQHCVNNRAAYMIEIPSLKTLWTSIAICDPEWYETRWTNHDR